LQAGIDPQTAFEACQDHVLALAQARVERFVLEAFQAAVQKEPALSELCVLFGIACVQADSSFFLEHGYLAPAVMRGLRSLQHALLAEIAPHALDYIAAFGIPKHCLGPLADPNYLESSGLANS
jgi:acyl-CoA oxidase